MVSQVGKIIIEQIKTLPFIDKYAGVVKPIVYNEKNDKTTIRKTFPAECTITATECENYSRYKDLVPDSSKKSILYLEDTGFRITKRDGNLIYFTTNYDLICWLNMPKLGFSNCSYSSIAILSILKKLPVRPFNDGIFNLINIQVIGQKPKSTNLFSKYSYDEAITQFLMYPYDYFGLPMQVDFRVDLRCLEIPELNPALNCINK